MSQDRATSLAVSTVPIMSLAQGFVSMQTPSSASLTKGVSMRRRLGSLSLSMLLAVACSSSQTTTTSGGSTTPAPTPPAPTAEPTTPAPTGRVCCESYGHGAMMVECCQRVEWSTAEQCRTGEQQVGGGRRIVDNARCEAPTPRTDPGQPLPTADRDRAACTAAGGDCVAVSDCLVQTGRMIEGQSCGVAHLVCCRPVAPTPPPSPEPGPTPPPGRASPTAARDRARCASAGGECVPQGSCHVDSGRRLANQSCGAAHLVCCRPGT